MDTTQPCSAYTSMHHSVWQHWLNAGYASSHPAESVEILRGITHGVEIDFTGPRDTNPRCANHPMSDADRDKVSAIIAADVAAGKKSGPHDAPPFPFFWCSPIGCVPKKGSAKVRVIHDLSHGAPHSVNDHIEWRLHRLGNLDDALDAIRRYGVGALLIKLDVEAAYKQIPIAHADWHLTGFMWLGKYYYDRTLPFGLASSCRKWDLYGSALHYFMQHHLGIECTVHYVDDFLFIVRPLDIERARRQRDMALRMCSQLGMPMAAGKTEGPTTCLTFLGIEIDTLAMQARLSADRLSQLHTLLSGWGDRTSASIHDLQSLAGLLNFVCRVVRPGRIYLRAMISQITALLHHARGAHPHAARLTSRSRDAPHTLSRAVRDDVAWWRHALTEWNGIGILYDMEWTAAVKLELFTDACLTGYGAVCAAACGTRTEWFQGRWTDAQLAASRRASRESMPYLELLALVLAAATWSHMWAGKRIQFRCDCQPVVQALSRFSSPEPDMHHLIRQLHAIAVRAQFDFQVAHIAGVSNVSADALSRYDMSTFRADSPRAAAHATPVAPLTLPYRTQ